MALNEKYVLLYSFEQYFVDKDTGAPLAGGTLSFYQDIDMVTPKNVFKLSGGPPYTDASYISLTNQVTLSAVGTPQDNDDNNISIYAYPYDADGNLQLYYIAVANSNGVPQFTRHAVPNISPADDPANAVVAVENALSNSQFVNVLFDPALGITLQTSAAGTTASSIAPDWDLIITCTAATDVAISRIAIAGSQVYPNNPPYTLNFVPSANITALTLRQRLFNNPGIWAPAVADKGGYIAGSMMLGAGTQATMLYAPSNLASNAYTVVVTGSNTTGSPIQVNNTVELAPSTNVAPSAGYVDILIQLPIVGASRVSNIQVVGLSANQANIPYQQQTVNRQEDYLFHYYNPRLSYRPTPSYLCGWDFPLNPAQLLGSTVAVQAVGANKSFYAWDQTIVFQNTNSGVSVSRGPNGELVLTCAIANTQCAIIQYLDSNRAREMLNSRMSVGIESKTSNVAGITSTINMYYTSGTPLPSMAAGTNNSLVETLDTTGGVATFNLANAVAWTPVAQTPRGTTRFNVMPNATTNFNFNGFSGWSAGGVAGTATATWIAIVIGFAPMALGDTISINSVGVVPGDIPCRPGPQSFSSVLNECRHYYSKSYNLSVLPGAITAVGQRIAPGASMPNYTPPSNTASYSNSFVLDFLNSMRGAPNISIYSPVTGVLGNCYAVLSGGGANLVNGDVNITTLYKAPTISFSSANYISNNGSLGNYTTAGPVINSEAYSSFHYVADARIGIV